LSSLLRGHCKYVLKGLSCHEYHRLICPMGTLRSTRNTRLVPITTLLSS
jgi:hypothetical protein